MQRSKKAAPILGKFGACLGLSLLVDGMGGNTDVREALSQMGVDEQHVKALGKIVTGLSGNKLKDYYDQLWETASYGLNENLEKAFAEAISVGCKTLRAEFIAGYNLKGPEKRQAELFFQSLAVQLSGHINSYEAITEYAVNREAFIRSLIKEVILLSHGETEDGKTLIPEIDDDIAQKLADCVVKDLETHIRKYVNEELKRDEKAKTIYYVHLLEYNARVNHENQEALRLLAESIEKVILRKEADGEIQKSLARTQQWITDKLRGFAYQFNDFVAKDAAFKARLGAMLEPSLTVPDYSTLSGRKDFSYRCELRYTSFIQREEEMNRLWDFLIGKSGRKFTWWMVTGPGGIGKSRLALELCLQARLANWYAGVLEQRQIAGFNWSQWYPQRKTLIVIENAGSQLDLVEKLIGELSRAEQNKPSDMPVRLLLLEREIDEDKLRNFAADPAIALGAFSTNNPPEPLELPPFEQEHLWSIIAEVHRKEHKSLPKNKDEILANLLRIDPKMRPLFAFFAGMAIAENQDIRKWDVHDLLADLLRREEKDIWSKHPKWQDEKIREGHKNLLLLTTLTGGLTVDSLIALFSEKNGWLPMDQPDESLYRLMSDVSDAGDYGVMYEGLKPDLVGEYYVLSRLDSLLKDRFKGSATTQSILDKAWLLRSENTWWNVWSTFTDLNGFSNQRVIQLLTSSKPPETAGEEVWGNWSKTASNLIDYYGSSSSFSEAERLYVDLVALSRRYDSNEEIVLRLAKVAYILITDYRSSSFSDSERLYADLVALSRRYDSNEEIVLWQVKAAYYLIHSCDSSLCLEAERLYADLVALSRRYNSNEEIVLRQAEAAFNMTNFYDSSSFSNLERLYSDLVALNHRDNSNKEIMLRQALASFNLITFYGSSSISDSERLYFDLVALSQRDESNNEDIVLWQAAASSYLIVLLLEEAMATSKLLFFKSLIRNLEVFIDKYDFEILIKKYNRGQTLSPNLNLLTDILKEGKDWLDTNDISKE